MTSNPAMDQPGLDGRYRDWPIPPEPRDTAYGVPEQIQCEVNFQDTLICPIDREREKSDMEFKSLQLFAGNDKTYVCYAKTRCLDPIDITGGVAVLSLKRDRDDTAFVLQKRTDVAGEGEIGAANKGEFYFYIVPADTTGWEYRQYPFDIKLQDASGKVYTVAHGVIELQEPVNL